MLNGLFEKILKHHKILNMALVIPLGVILSSVLTSLFHGSRSDSSFLVFIFSFFGLIGTIFLGCLSLAEVGKDNMYDLPSLLGIHLFKKHYKKIMAKIKPHQHLILTSDEKNENIIAHNFVNLMFYLNQNYAKASIHFKAIAEFYFDTNDYTKHATLIESIYQTHFKDLGMAAKTLVLALNGHRIAREQFFYLWSLNYKQFSSFEIDYIEHHIKSTMELKFYLFKKLLPEDTKLLFSQFSFATQTHLLQAMHSGDLSDSLYNELVAIHKAKDEYQQQGKIEHNIEEKVIHLANQTLPQEIHINSHTQKTLTNFESQFNDLFEKSNVLHSIEELMLTKERMSSLLEHFDFKQSHFEAKLFLDNDVDKVLQNFSEEILILTKMKFNHHPKLEERKISILNSMKERISIIQQKMLNINQDINDSMDNELENQMQVNKQVLQAKV